MKEFIVKGAVNWRTTLSGLLSILLIVLDMMGLLTTTIVLWLLGVLVGIGLILAKDAEKVKNRVKLILLLVLPSLSLSCSPEFQKSVQKSVADAHLYQAVAIAKNKVPDKEIKAVYDKANNTYTSQEDDLVKYVLIKTSDSTQTIHRQIDWMFLFGIIQKEIHAFIDKGYLVIGKPEDKKSDKDKPEKPEQLGKKEDD
jgi:hypothetical protein